MKKVLTVIQFSAIILGLVVNLKAQQSTQSKGNDPKKELVIEYLNSFQNYVTQPDNYKENSQNLLQYWTNPNSNRNYNFLSPKARKKGYVSSDSLLRRINTDFPDGLGMVFNPEQIELVSIKKNLLSKIYVYKTKLELSGFTNTGDLASYTGDQFFYISDKTQNPRLEKISDETYFKNKYTQEIYRQGLIIEPFFDVASFIFPIDNEYYNDQKYDEEYGNLKSELNYDIHGKLNFKLNFGLNTIYMFKPYIGLGLGLSSYNYNQYYSLVSENYPLAEALGYIPLISTGQTSNFEQGYPNNEELLHTVEVSSTNIPLFIRLQTGWNTFSVSADLGFGHIFKPSYNSYLDGAVRYYGQSVITGEIVKNDPTLGFGTYSYTNELVHKKQSDEGRNFMFGRVNLHLQPSKFFYFRLSGSIQQFIDIEYTESWHMFDMYTLRIPNASEIAQAKTYKVSFEIGLGFNIAEIVVK